MTSLRVRTAALFGAVALLALPAATPGVDVQACAQQTASTPAATSATPTDRTREASQAEDRIIDLDQDGPHRAYFQLKEPDADPGPVPAIGWWKNHLPRNRDAATDPHRLLVANSDPDDDSIQPPPKFAGEIIGEFHKLGVRLARAVFVAEGRQETVELNLAIDGVPIIEGAWEVEAFDGRFDPCHLIEYGWYYVVFTDVDRAIEAAGIQMGPGISHHLQFSWAPTGDGEGDDTDAFAIDTQLAASSLEFDGGSTPGPKFSLAP